MNHAEDPCTPQVPHCTRARARTHARTHFHTHSFDKVLRVFLRVFRVEDTKIFEEKIFEEYESSQIKLVLKAMLQAGENHKLLIILSLFLQALRVNYLPRRQV